MINKNINDYYENIIDESNRLDTHYSLVEFERTKEIISRYLPGNATLNILDLGAASGKYSFWLKSLDHNVTMVEPVGKHIEIAKNINSKLENKITIIQGNALDISFKKNAFDMVLNFGPIYHLTNKEDRLLLHKKIHRMLKASGLYFTSFISRFATLLDGYRKDIMDDEEYVNIVKQDLQNGQHRGSKDRQRYFTDAYFYLPEEMNEELKSLGFANVELFSIESFSWILDSLNNILKNNDQKHLLYDFIKSIEKEKSILGVSPHILSKCNRKSV